MHSSSISNHIPTRKLDNHSNRKKNNKLGKRRWEQMANAHLLHAKST
jgi:hypothetical protein